MTDPTSLPLYLQISESLTRDIQAGRLLDGERLAPEREMAAGFGTSVGTLRKALADLARRGLVDRRHGSGNYVRAQADAGGVYAFFRLEKLDGGGLPTARVLDVARLRKPADAPGFGPSPDAHRIRRLRFLDRDPVSVEEIWLDAAQVDHLAASDLSESLYYFYRRRLGLWISRVEDRIGVGTVPDWAPAGQGPVPGRICGHVERLGFDSGGGAVEYSRTWFDNDKARYVSRLR